MALAAGTRLGAYEIMGEVYRARDTNLNRDVAIKVLPAARAQDAARLKRECPFQMMEVDVTLAPTFMASPPRRLFDAPFPADVIRVYDLTPDAGRFIFLRETYPPSTSSPREMHVIENWFEELKHKVR